MNASKPYFTDSVADMIREAIAEAGGNEVFVTGVLNRDGTVCEARVAARGHATAVPVIESAVSQAEVLIHNHPSGRLEPSDADLQIASRVSEGGLGFYIVNNDLTRVYVVVEPVLLRERIPVETGEIDVLLGEDGPLSESNQNYEPRETQIALSRNIASAFNASLIGVFEAGTGVGKSYAYLIPAALWAIRNDDRVVVSTATINLQQQLMDKDIPTVRKIVGTDFKAVLMKGRQNYLCRRRFAEAMQERDLFEDETAELEAIGKWAETTADGSRSDLSFMPKETVWSRICSESDACMGVRCAFHENCFVMRVRKEAASASLIVVNHHLLFADLEARMAGVGYDDTAVLPPFHHIVFDEAHAIEDAATSFFSEYFTRFKVLKQISILYRVRRGSVGGHIIALERLSDSAAQVQHALAFINEIRDSYAALEEAALRLLGPEGSYRLSDASFGLAAPVLECMATLRKAIAGFAGTVREVLEGIPEDAQNDPVVWESKFALRRLEFVGTLCLNFTEWSERRESVFWIERLRQRDGTLYPRFVQTPLSIAPMMRDGVFEPFSTVICTSATLRIGQRFDYWLHRVGLDLVEESRFTSGIHDSPFPYRGNVLLTLPTDAPLPEEAGYQAWVQTAVVSLLQSSGGHALVLFTSYESLRSACTLARESLSPLGLTILKQGDDDRSRLLDTFRNDESSVLFATDSFWEGVDAPGDALLHVIITKLPFRVPSDPVHAARAEAIEKSGANAFMELSLPEAVMRFRQGFGRLMRRKTDRGVVTVLDRRILAKKYGKIFLESLPETRQCFEPLRDVLPTVERFLYN